VTQVSQPTLNGPIGGDPAHTLGELDLRRLGYSVEEWFMEGTARSWQTVGEVGEDGRWSAEPAATAPFKTRLLLCRPTGPGQFGGTVVVEWLNVSAGGDGSPDWFFVHRHLIREGAAWPKKPGSTGAGWLWIPASI
jgi:Alpha/beta hydrolase domain